MTATLTPYAVAMANAENGWRVFPCRPTGETIKGKVYAAKSPIWAGTSGWDWRVKASSDPVKIRSWFEEYPDALMAVAIPDGMTVIDIDRHGDNDGFAYAERENWPTIADVMGTSVSGLGRHLWYAGESNQSDPAKGFINRRTGGSGYVVTPYVLPPVAEVTEPLPEVYRAEVTPKVEADAEALSWLSDGMSTYVQRWIENLPATLNGWDSMTPYTSAISDMTWNGQSGTRAAFEALESVWLSTEHASPDPTAIRKSMERMLTADRPQVPDTIEALEVPELAEPAPDDEAFWCARPELTAIRTTAGRLMSSPWALFGGLALRALHTIPPHVRYVSFMGPASLNAYAVMVGTSGAGKSIQPRQLDEFFPMKTGPKQWAFYANEVGSGEAIPELFARLAGKPAVVEFHNPEHPAAQVVFDEVGKLTSITSRQGATILDYLKTAWSGGTLGRHLANGSGFNLPTDTYRLTGIINAQPDRSGKLVSEDEKAGGFTGRLLWFNAQDARIAENPDYTPAEPFAIEVPQWGLYESIMALPEMNEQHRADGVARMRGELDSLSGQEPMARVKVAVALMVLNNRHVLNSEDWELAGEVIAHSRSVRSQVIAAVRTVSANDAERRGRAKARENVATQETEDELMLAKTIARFESFKADKGRWPNNGELSAKQIAYKDQAREALGIS